MPCLRGRCRWCRKYCQYPYRFRLWPVFWCSFWATGGSMCGTRRPDRRKCRCWAPLSSSAGGRGKDLRASARPTSSLRLTGRRWWRTCPWNREESDKTRYFWRKNSCCHGSLFERHLRAPQSAWCIIISSLKCQENLKFRNYSWKKTPCQNMTY